MGHFSRDELEQALAHYTGVVEECTRSGDWGPFADLFTEDCTYIEHAYGIFEGREAKHHRSIQDLRPGDKLIIPINKFMEVRIRNKYLNGVYPVAFFPSFNTPVNVLGQEILSKQSV